MSKARIAVSEFVRAYLSAVDRGLTRDALAKELGIKSDSVYQRAYLLNRQLAATGKQLPPLPTAGRRSVFDLAMEAYIEFVNQGTSSNGQLRVHNEGSDDVLAEILG